MKRVVVVGMGFGGLRAAKVLAGRGGDLLLVDRRNYHLFQPLLYQVATAGLDQDSIAYPVRAIIRRWPATRFLLAEVREFALDRQLLVTDRGPLPYDYLVLATGSATHYYGVAGAEQHAFVLKKLDDAIALRNQILSMFERAVAETDAEERQALLTFVLVGAGATGVELSGSVAELVQHTLARDYPELAAAHPRVLLIEALPQVLPALPAPLQSYAHHRLSRLGVELLTERTVTEVGADFVRFQDGTLLRTHTLVWTAGVRATPLAAGLPGPKGPGGRVRVQPDLSLAGYPNVYVVGDLAYVEQDGTPLAMVAPVAMQEGEYAARSILAREAGRALEPFHYRDKGTMAIIGRFAAVARAFGINMRGLLAWLAWLALHLYYLGGFRNRLIALLNWVYALLLQDPKVRLITRYTGHDGQTTDPQ